MLETGKEGDDIRREISAPACLVGRQLDDIAGELLLHCSLHVFPLLALKLPYLSPHLKNRAGETPRISLRPLRAYTSHPRGED